MLSWGEIMRKLGYILILFGVLLTTGGYRQMAENHREDHRAGQAAQVILEKMEFAEAGATEQAPDAPEPQHVPLQCVDGEEYMGILHIPALELELPVMHQWSYPRLRKAPCRYSGSLQTEDLVLMAHNYPSHFGNLKKLVPGDAVVFSDAAGNQHLYLVTSVGTLDPGDFSKLREGQWNLALFTCTPGGSARVVVKCIADREAST